MQTISINGIRIQSNDYGANIIISDGKISVNGKDVKLKDCKDIKIVGNVHNIRCEGRVEIHGNVTGDVDANSVVCGDVGGSVDGTNVKCSKVGGSIDGTNVSVR